MVSIHTEEQFTTTTTAPGAFSVMRGWSLQSATVVCNQLGLGIAKNYSTSVFQGSPVQNFLMTKTNCKGNEDFLKDCAYEFWKIGQGCSGQHVPEVICEGMCILISTTITIVCP